MRHMARGDGVPFPKQVVQKMSGFFGMRPEKP